MVQVNSLVESGSFEEALNLCTLSPVLSTSQGIKVKQIQEKYALSLFLRGDFDGAVTHFIAAGSEPSSVLLLFSDPLVPSSLNRSNATSPLLGQVSSLNVRGLTSSSSNPAALGMS
jgi:hypothetical protein